MFETSDDLERLQHLLDASAESAGPHMRSIITPERRLSAEELCRRMQGMCLLALATVTADGRPMVGPVDGYLIRGSLHFSTGRQAVRARHLAARPAVSATYLPGEDLAVTVHGRAELYDLSGPAGEDQRRAMLDHYLPVQGPAFQQWLEKADAVGVRIEAERMFTFHTA